MDSLLFDAGWFFFAFLIAVLVGLSITAFGRDLLPSKALESACESHSDTQSVTASRKR